MKSNKPNKSSGFTIIETLIVLAIAATIFLVVFLAVSSLNRSSRNTQRKDDASALLAGMGNFISNNSGQLPALAAAGTLAFSPPNITLPIPTGSPSGTGVAENVKLAHYISSGVSIVNGQTYSGTTSGATTDQLIIDENATCQSGSSSAPGTTGAYAILWAIESGSTPAWNWGCIGG